jgi:hypothetical protein
MSYQLFVIDLAHPVRLDWISLTATLAASKAPLNQKLDRSDHHILVR